ncbi:PREDICTED: biotinidase-like [Poecilia mexicana]|uniref:biotinidase-like n=1 Tax=Poecilia mexicana TaxID=48701 RepID=UPI00072E8463|nr:PREDICTED: biotinidase-like [Poecilia mexicana]
MLVVFLLVFCLGETESAADSYVAALYEHRVILNPNPRVPVSRREALIHMQKNLDIYEEQAAKAAQQGVQILVFPEDGIHGFNFTRSSISGYMETIPDPQEESWNPCTEPDKHNNTEVLQRLSCMARRNNLYLVANMPDLQPCPLKTAPSTCPPDGHWQFNTNVAFNSDGLLVARYHKQNLYYEESFDTPPKLELITFDTPFAGKFGLIICFDILFHDPTVALVKMGVRQLVFPTAWMNELPLLDSIQFHRAFSLGANVTVLSSNLRYDKLRMTGSGIYTPFSATFHHAVKGDPEEGQLLVATVPVLGPVGVNSVTESLSPVDAQSDHCHTDGCADSPSPGSSYPTFKATMRRDLYWFVLINETQGNLTVCHGTFCCHLQYKWTAHDKSKELYALGAFAGTHNSSQCYALQVCAVVRCAGLEAKSCGQKVEEAESKMDFRLEATFQTDYVYPSRKTGGSVHLQQYLSLSFSSFSV